MKNIFGWNKGGDSVRRLACCRLSTGEEQERWFPFFCKGLTPPPPAPEAEVGRGGGKEKPGRGQDRNSEEDNSREEAGEQLGP